MKYPCVGEAYDSQLIAEVAKIALSIRIIERTYAIPHLDKWICPEGHWHIG